MLLDKAAHLGHALDGFGEERREEWVAVNLAHFHPQGRVHPGGLGFLGKADRIIAHGFVVTDHDQQGRQTVQVAVQRGDPRLGGVVVAAVVLAAHFGHIPAARGKP